MRATLRALGWAVAVMLAVPGTGAAQDENFMKVPEAVWTNTNRFVFLVALDPEAAKGTPEYYRRSVLKSWPEAYAAAEQWNSETFPGLQRIAAELAEDNIGDRLKLMLKAAEAVARGQTDQREVFDTEAGAIETKMTSVLGSADALKGKIDRLVAASGAIQGEMAASATSDPALLEIKIRAELASAALGSSVNAWRNLQSNVTEFRRVVAAARQIAPDWYTLIAPDRWSDVTRDAKGFLANIKTQQRYLSGEDYYDNCGVQEGRWYSLDMQGGNLGHIPLYQAVEAKGQVRQTYLLVRRGVLRGGLHEALARWVQWQFKKHGAGWWQLRNMAWGESYALDGARVGVGVFTVSSTSGQLWRVMPAEGNRCYLINSSRGARYALEAMPTSSHLGTAPAYDSYRVDLKPTTKAARQQWSFTAR